MGGLTVHVASARIRVEVADPVLAEALRDHLAACLDVPWTPPTVRVVDADDDTDVRGALVLLRVRTASSAALVGRAEALQAAGARAIQLVWSGRPRRYERAVFAVLETWRGHRRPCPLLLGPAADPEPALLRALAADP